MVKPIFNKEENEYIKAHWQNMTYSEIAIELNKFNSIKKDEKQVRSRARAMGICKINKQYNKRYFKNINTAEKAYWLGFIYADGYVISNPNRKNYELGIELNGIDHKHLVQFSKTLGNNIKVTHRLSRDRFIDNVFVAGGTLNSVIRVYSKDMVNDLISHNIVTNKTYREEYPIVQKFLFIDFIRGVIDGDGCIDQEYGRLRINITNPNLPFLHYVHNFLEEIGIKSSIYTEKQWKSRIIIDGANAEKFGHLLYDNSSLFLKRKHDKYLSLTVKTA